MSWPAWVRGSAPSGAGATGAAPTGQPGATTCGREGDGTGKDGAGRRRRVPWPVSWLGRVWDPSREVADPDARRRPPGVGCQVGSAFGGVVARPPLPRRQRRRSPRTYRVPRPVRPTTS